MVQGYGVLTPPVGRNVNETMRQIQASQQDRESKGTQATPPGKPVLKNGPGLVGRVWEEWKVTKAFD